MSGKALNCLIATALLYLQQGTIAFADDTSCTPEPGLKRYIGSYDSNLLLRDPRIDTPLRNLLGNQYSHLIDNLDVSGSVDLIAGDLSLTGNAIHGGGLEEAVVCVSLFDGAVSAAIFTRGMITVFSHNQDYPSQRQCIKDWVTQVNSGHADRLRMPDNLRMATN